MQLRLHLPRAAAQLLTLLVAAGALVAVPGSGEARAATLAVARDVPVTTLAGAVSVDVWRQRVQRSRRPRPVALLVHGGGWHTGDKRQWEQSRWAQRLAARGWLVVNTNYRLACGLPGARAARLARDPRLCGHPMGTSVADVRATLRYTASRARRWGGDPSRIVLFGASAGAQLAMLAASDRGRPAGVLAVVAISPPTDLAWVGARPDLPIHGSAALSIGCLAAQCAGAWEAASPVQHVRRGVTPPTWLFAAPHDPITPIGPVRRYAMRLRATGIPTVVAVTADPQASCHGPLPCAAARVDGSRLGPFEHALQWLHTQLD